MWAAVLVLGAALLVAPWFGHFDDTDAQLYQVVVRKMAQRRSWFDPAYLDHFAPHFREHLPFGLWPFTAAELAVGEQGPRVLALLLSLALLAGTGLVGQRLMGPWPAIGAMAVLATTESFFRYGAETRLDPLLVLLANLAAVPALLSSTRILPWVAAGMAAALAVLVKGPFGLVPLVAAAVAKAVDERSLSVLVRAGIAGILACLPVSAFLLLDRFVLHAGWWETYGQGQLVASATGMRIDGASAWWFPFTTIAGRFWPGLALIAALAIKAIARQGIPRETRTLAVFSAVMLVALCIPGRKVWNHALVVYPGLALLAGSSLAPFGAWFDRRARAVARVAIAAAFVAVVSAPWIGRLVDRDPCVGFREFRAALDQLGKGDPILVVSDPTSWRMLASLAAERHLEPEPVSSLREGASSDAEVALVQDEGSTAVPSAWTLVGSARGWTLLEKSGARTR